MTPLPLDSPRWRLLKAHFGNAGIDAGLPSVPSLLARWHRTVGSYAEEYAYEDIFASYLHQRTILDVAYAVVPHLAARLLDLDRDRCLSVLDHLALVEQKRLTPPEEVEATIREIERTVDAGLHDIFIQRTRDRHPSLPDDLAPAYLAAIEQSMSLAGADWGLGRSQEAGPHHFRRHVRYLRGSGWTEDDIGFAITALTDETGGFALVHRGAASALEGLRRVEGPVGWLERTGLYGGGDSERLRFLALHSLAWLALRIDVATMLRES